MAGPTYQFVMRTGPTPGKVYPVEKNEIFIGRDLGNDIVISDAEISRRHARLVMQAGGFVLEDLGSTNGTVVNGQRLMGPYLLRPGETVAFGEHVMLVFEAFDADATLASAAQPAQAAPIQMPPPAGTPAQPVYVPPSPIPSYSGQVPPGPPSDSEPLQPEKKSTTPIIIAIVVVLLMLICACGLILWFIDNNNLWCSLPFGLIPGCP